MTPSSLATTCDAGGERAPFTGTVEEGPRGLVAVCACPSCRAELRTLRPAAEPQLRAWMQAQATTDARWHHGWKVLRSGDAPSLRVLFRDAAENAEWPLPLVARRGRYTDADGTAAFKALPARFQPGHSARALRPLMKALQGTPANAFAETRWLKPELREALEPR